MKHVLTALTFALCFSVAMPATSQTNSPLPGSFTLVTNLWYQGYKTNVLAIAEERLLVNSNDVAGLVLRMEYDLEFSNVDLFSNNIIRVLSAAGDITNQVFRSNYPKMESSLTHFLHFLANSSPPSSLNIDNEKAKAAIIHKRMIYERYLKWLHDDGLF